MKLETAKAILGPIRCGWRRQRKLGAEACYYVDGKPANVGTVIEAAKRTPDFIKARMLKADAKPVQERQRKRRDIDQS